MFIVALLTYFRLLQQSTQDEDVETTPIEGEDVMKLYLQDRKSWLEKRLKDYERKIVMDLGRDGEPAYLEGKDKEDGAKALKELALNTVLSDRMPLNRTLRDPRNKG